MQVNCKVLLNQQHAFTRAKESDRGTRPEDGVRLFDALHRAALDLEATASAPSMPPAAAQSLVAAAAASSALFAAGRALHVALLRRGRSDHAAAVALCKIASQRLEEARDAAGALAAEAASDALAGWSGSGLHVQLYAQLEAMVAGFAALCQAEAAVSEDKQQSQVAEGVSNLSLQQDGETHVRPAKRKAGQQEDTGLSAGSASFASLVDAKKGKSDLVSLADLLQPLPMRPILLDTAAQFITEPDIGHRCSSKVQAQRQEQGGSMMQSIKGLFGFR